MFLISEKQRHAHISVHQGTKQFPILVTNLRNLSLLLDPMRENE
jgi:hypothetical protein